ncbi:MAG: MnhB domain-containing protein [Bacillota bacterium]
MDDLVTRSVCRLMVPFVQLYGAYLIFYGHLSPGGGFAGGAVVASSIILYALSFGRETAVLRVAPGISHLLESSGGLWYLLVGLCGIMLGGNFLANKAAGFYLGIPGQLFSSGIIFLLALGIGMKVSSTMVTLYYNLSAEVNDEDGHGI